MYTCSYHHNIHSFIATVIFEDNITSAARIFCKISESLLERSEKHNAAITVESDVIPALTDSLKQTTYFLNTLVKITCVAGINGEGGAGE